MNKILNIFLISLLMIAACACHKENRFITDMPITMSLTESGSSKALLDDNTFETPGNQIKIYDYYSEGSIEEGYYINDVIECSAPGNWPFVRESHKWTTDGIHEFFGWMINDVNENEPFTPSFGVDKVLRIPLTTLGQSSVQYDFMYSDIHERNLNNNPYFTSVPLNFSHLFTAFKITASNKSSNRVVLRSVTVSGLKNQKSATINYSDAALINRADETQANYPPIVEYLSQASDGIFFFNKESNGGGSVLDPYDPYNPILPEPVSNDYYLMWPQTSADFKGDETLPAAIISVVYDYIELDDNGNVTMTQENVRKDVKLEAVGSWVAGNKYDLNLQFKDKEIVLQCIVQDWIPMEEEIDFTEQVYASKPLTWVEGTVEYDDPASGRVVLFSDEDKVAECVFKIDTPKGATWTASLISIEGHPDAFSIVEDTKYGPVGLERSIKIKINNIDPISPRHVCKLRITVQTADGRTIVANNLMPKETEEEITEYTIIQNRING